MKALANNINCRRSITEHTTSRFTALQLYSVKAMRRSGFVKQKSERGVSRREAATDGDTIPYTR